MSGTKCFFLIFPASNGERCDYVKCWFMVLNGIMDVS